MSFIQTSCREGIYTITLNRPDKLNAFTGTMREDLLEALHGSNSEPDTRVVVITGAGRAFCAGGDIDFMNGLREKNDTEGLRALLDAGGRVVTAIADLPFPVIASVNGVAAGAGCNLALACDIRIASDRAKFSESFVRIGLHPDWGGTWLLPRLVGPSRAMELLVTGRMVEADEALRIGLVDRVVPGDDLELQTMELARSIAAGPPVAIRGIKRALRQSAESTLQAQLELEAANQLEAFSSQDAVEGMTAFLETRTPLFRGE